MELNRQPTEQHDSERLPWHKPRIQRLDVRIDTKSRESQAKTGSFEDGNFEGAPFPITT